MSKLLYLTLIVYEGTQIGEESSNYLILEYSFNTPWVDYHMFWNILMLLKTESQAKNFFFNFLFASFSLFF